MSESTLNGKICQTQKPYANLHAARLEDMLAHWEMRDVFRLMHGELASGFRRECKSIATRIERIYSRVRMAFHPS